MSKKGCCRECKYADWDADGCTCMIDGFIVCNASDYTCDQYRPAKPLTNADRIRQMTDEELADKLTDKCAVCAYHNAECETEFCFCGEGVLQWLKQEVSGDAGSKTEPTIEAEPVRHGRWIQSDALDYKDPIGVIHVHGMCSCCRMIYDFRDMTSRFKFCPNCGARMDGGADNG